VDTLIESLMKSATELVNWIIWDGNIRNFNL